MCRRIYWAILEHLIDKLDFIIVVIIVWLGVYYPCNYVKNLAILFFFFRSLTTLYVLSMFITNFINEINKIYFYKSNGSKWKILITPKYQKAQKLSA